MTTLADEVLARSRAVIDRDLPVALHEPEFAGNEKRYVAECIETGWVSSVGAFVDRFERELERATGAAHAVVCVNGTAGLEIALRLAGVTRDDEVIIPSLTFVATANAVVHAGGVPHLVDAEASTLGIDVAALARHLEAVGRPDAGGTVNRQTGRRIGAIVPVHVFGHPCDIEDLVALGDDRGIPVVEDATEALGSSFRGRGCGTFGRLGVLSFNGNKIITTGGGGAILTNDADLAARAKRLTTTAKRPHRWAFDHDDVAWNYRLPNLNAALGCAQIERLPDMLRRKGVLAQRYAEAFESLPDVAVHRQPAEAISNNWLNAIVLHEDRADQRDNILATTNDAGLGTRPLWTPMHRLPMYAGCPQAALPVTESLAGRIVNLPSSAFLVAS